MSAVELVKSGYASYLAKTPYRVRLTDIFIVLQIYLAVAISMFVVIAGSFPFNSYLSAVFAALGSATLGAALRMQLTQPDTFKLSEGQAFGEYLICCAVLHLACFNFLG